MIPRLKEQFNTELKQKIMSDLQLSNVNEIPSLEKIIINIGDGKAATDGRALESMVDELEKVIDELTEKNGIPEYFVVPGNNSISSKLDWCRVVSRRAERRCVTWKELNKLEDSFVITYLNRLSDLLWMMARDYEDEWTASK